MIDALNIGQHVGPVLQCNDKKEFSNKELVVMG
jgi:hypothetical protein